MTLDFTSQGNWDIPTSGTNTELATFTDGTYSIKLYAATNYKLNNGYLNLGKKDSYLELPAFDFAVAKIKITGTSGASTGVKQNIYVGDDAVSTETTGAKDVTNTYEIAADKQAAGTIYKLMVTSAHNTQISKIEIFKANGEVTPEPADVYTVAGTTDLTGYNWDPTQNQMTLKDGLYQWTATGILVDSEHQPKFKVVKNNSWDNAWPDNDWVITPTYLGAEGIYDITITFDPKTNEIGVTGVKTSFNTIAELTALENNKAFTFFGEALVVAKMAKSDGKTYVYIKDDTGSSLIYDDSGAKTENAAVGKTIAANWTGKVSIYKNLFELVPDQAIVVKEGDAVEVTYPEATAADVIALNVNKVVTIKGLAITATDDKNNITFTYDGAEIKGYNQFGIELPTDYEGNTYDVVGAIGRFNDNIQFQPITLKENEKPLVISFDMNGDVVSINRV